MHVPLPKLSQEPLRIGLTGKSDPVSRLLGYWKIRSVYHPGIKFSRVNRLGKMAVSLDKDAICDHRDAPIEREIRIS